MSNRPSKFTSALGVIGITFVVIILFAVLGSILLNSNQATKVDDELKEYYVEVQNGPFGYYVSNKVTVGNSIHEDNVTEAVYYGDFSIHIRIGFEEWDLLNSGDDVSLYRINGRLYVRAQDIEKLVNELESE